MEVEHKPTKHRENVNEINLDKLYGQKTRLNEWKKKNPEYLRSDNQMSFFLPPLKFSIEF